MITGCQGVRLWNQRAQTSFPGGRWQGCHCDSARWQCNRAQEGLRLRINQEQGCGSLRQDGPPRIALKSWSLPATSCSTQMQVVCSSCGDTRAWVVEQRETMTFLVSHGQAAPLMSFGFLTSKMIDQESQEWGSVTMVSFFQSCCHRGNKPVLNSGLSLPGMLC